MNIKKKQSFTNSKKAQGLSLNTVVVAAMVILVLIVIAIIVIRYSSKFADNAGGCTNQGGKCVDSVTCGKGFFKRPDLSESCRTGETDKTICCMPGKI